jgi:hypothetical protein
VKRNYVQCVAGLAQCLKSLPLEQREVDGRGLAMAAVVKVGWRLADDPASPCVWVSSES